MIQLNQNIPKTVWVIDDDETVLLLAEEVLTGAGFNVRTFSDAAAALIASTDKIPDIVVVDVVMPGINGYEFCSRLRQLPQGALIPILVTTSLDDPDSMIQACQAGATNFTVKPVNWNIEVQRLHYLLKSADVARELQVKVREARLAGEEWEQTFKAVGDPVTILDTNLKILRLNTAAAALLKLPVDAALGRHCREMLNCSTKSCSNCPATKALLTGKPVTCEGVCGPADRAFDVTVSPVTDVKERVTRLVLVIRDLTERKKMEAELRQAQKMEALGTLAGGIAHDFNNILTVVRGYAELLNAKTNPPCQDLRAILDAARRGSALTKQMLVFSRKGAALSIRKSVNLNDSIRGVVKILEKGVAKNVSVHLNTSPNLRSVLADPEQMEQVIMNMAVNASQAMREGGELAFATQNFTPTPDFLKTTPSLTPGDYVKLVISDTGHGMDPKVMQRIYEPFFTTKKAGEGTGLGLSIVFGIVRDHRGLITCASEVGLGTTFTIYLPIAAEGEISPLPAPAVESPLRGGSDTVLVVDDELPICNMLKSFLSNLGYSVITACDGEMALKKYTTAKIRPHAIILDVGLPKMSGLECLGLLRDFDPKAKVLIATGYGGDNIETEARKNGASCLLAKPYKLTELGQTLRNVLDANGTN